MFNRIADYLAGIGVDKYIHFNACMFIAFFMSRAVHLFFGPCASAVAGFIVAVGVGYAKERIDSRRKGNGFDKADMMADIIGAVSGSLMSCL